MTDNSIHPTTTDAGVPVASDEHSLSVGPDGPLLLQDHYLIEQMANFNRERIPERQPHAKGGGAFGTFQVTQDVSAYTRAAVFQPGAETGVIVRFSTVAGERGSPDTWRDPRGFAVKFYTGEGNLDIVGNNTPVFFIKDPMKFQHFIRSQRDRALAGQDVAGQGLQLLRCASCSARGELPPDPGERPARRGPQLLQGRRHARGQRDRSRLSPNSYGGPLADPNRTDDGGLWHADGDMVRAAYTSRPDDDDWSQPGTLVREVLDHAARGRSWSTTSSGICSTGSATRFLSGPSSTGATSTRTLATESLKAWPLRRTRPTRSATSRPTPPARVCRPRHERQCAGRSTPARLHAHVRAVRTWRAVRDAIRADQAGFDFAVMSDHYFPWLDSQGHSPNAWPTLGAVAHATERIDLMTYVTCPTMRYHPAAVAQQAATVGLLSNGRFTLGLGAGENLNEHILGRGWPPANVRHEMLDEALQIITALFTGDYVGGGWKVNAELPGPAGFNAASQFVTADDIAKALPCGPDVDAHLEAIRAFVDAGFTDVAVVQIGGRTQTDFLDWAEKELLPAFADALA